VNVSQCPGWGNLHELENGTESVRNVAISTKQKEKKKKEKEGSSIW